MESYVIACNGDNVPPRVEPMTAAPEPSATGEMLRPLKRYVMNSSLPKKVVSPREKTSHDRHSPSTMTVSTDEGTNETSRGKAHCKSPYLAHQLLVFFTPIRYRVVKITCSYSEVVLWTTKHTIIYPSSGPSLEVIALHLAVWYWRWTTIIMGWAESLRSSWSEGENDLVPLAWRVGGLL
jgi:hypothetical protein